MSTANLFGNGAVVGNTNDGEEDSVIGNPNDGDADPVVVGAAALADQDPNADFDDEDAFATAAAAVAYGPVFEDPTVEGEDDFGLNLPPPHADETGAGRSEEEGEGRSSAPAATALDPQFWRHVLDLHTAASALQTQQPEPLHELAMMAENQTELGLTAMNVAAAEEIEGTTANSHHQQFHQDVDPSSNKKQAAAAAEIDDVNARYPENQLHAVDQEVPDPIPFPTVDMQQRIDAVYQPVVLPDRKAPAPDMDNLLTNQKETIMENLQVQAQIENPYGVDTGIEARPVFASPLKKRRHDKIIQHQTAGRRTSVTGTATPLPQRSPRQPSVVNNASTKRGRKASKARHELEEACARSRDAKKKLDELEIQLSRLQKAVEDARDACQRSEQIVQTMTDRHLEEILMENTPWNAMYRLLKRYKRDFGNTNVPRRWERYDQQIENRRDATTCNIAPVDMGKLGRWVGEQRRLYKQQRQHASAVCQQNDPLLEAHQIIALRRLGFDFDPLGNAWEKQYQRLRNYKSRHGHTRVKYESSFSFRSKPSRQQAAQAMLTHGDDSVNVDTIDDTKSLGSWVKRQRYQYKLYQEGDPASDMTTERIQRLNDLGFEWKLRGYAWKDYYAELKAFSQVHGNTLVPCTRKQLNEWTNEQRQQLRVYQDDPSLSDLTAEQAELLKELGLAESLQEGKWHRRFQELSAFKLRHGHCIVPTKYAFNPQLVNWCATQRRQYKLLEQGKKSQLTPDRVRVLTQVGFRWALSPKDRSDAKLVNATWEEQHAECLQLYNESGNLDGLHKDTTLHHWWTHQCQLYRDFKAGQPSPLSPYQVEQLERLEPTRDESLSTAAVWETRFAELLMHRVVHGSFAIASSTGNEKLLEFMDQQRREYVKYQRGEATQLDRTRVSKLDKVGFPWEVQLF